MWVVRLLNSTVISPFLYQRTRPDAPRFSLNIGQDGGVFIQFVRDYYHNLPNVTILLHATNDGPHMLANMYSLRREVDYVNLNLGAWLNRDTNVWAGAPYSGWVQECWWGMLQLADYPQLPE